MGKSDNFDDFGNNSLLKNISRQNLKHGKSRKLRIGFFSQTNYNSNLFKFELF